MATVASSPVLSSGTPSVSNTGTELQVSVPISNNGGEKASRVYITDMTVGSARRVSPQSFPAFVGDLARGNTGSANARFALAGLAVGQKYLLTIRGIYGARDPLGFTTSRYITIPAPAPETVVLLKSHVSALVQPARWAYTIFNDEAASSPLYISVFSLDIVAPISVTNTPAGWKVDTDLISYVGWHAIGAADPYANQIAPGHSLGGFEIQSATARSESTPFVLASWNHALNSAGAVNFDEVLSPARP